MAITDSDSRRTKNETENEPEPLEPRAALDQCIQTIEQVADSEDQARIVRTLAAYYDVTLPADREGDR